MNSPRPQHAPFDQSTYGRSFADVYDHWYEHRDPDALVTLVTELGGKGSPAELDVLELGAGTGRVALPLIRAGLNVTAMDSSPDMLELLRAKPDAERLTIVAGDVANPADYPDGPFDVVIAAFNLLCNLADRSAQQRCLDAVAARLAENGRLVVEAFVPDVPDERRKDLVTRSIDAESVVLIATDTDPSTSTISGAHLEFRDGSVRVRPWRVCFATPSELDDLARNAGLELVHRWADPTGTPFVTGEHAEHCSVYRLALSAGRA